MTTDKQKSMFADALLRLDKAAAIAGISDEVKTIENQITAANADRIKARYIVEIANGPTTSEADAVLNSKGIKLLPDILANAGGVTVSYFEWLQNRAGPWPLEKIHRKLREGMVSAFQAVDQLANTQNIDWRTAAYAVALGRLEEAIQSRGSQTFFRNGLHG